MSGIGQTLAHWYYEPYEWEYFVRADWTKAKQNLQRRYRLFAVIGLFIALFAGFLGIISASWFGAIVGFVWMGLPCAMFGGAAYLVDSRMRRGWYRRLRKASPEVIVTTEAVVFGGPNYTMTGLIKAIRGLGRSVQVSTDEGDFGFLTFNVTSYLFRSGTEQVNVLIPKGKEDEAARLAEEFNGL